jgi:putative FmdB family regulatory protein
MPIYGYRCPQNHLFEVFQRMSDEPVEQCEVCGEGPVVRVLYPIAVHFKGSGFYTTDYGRGSKRPKEASDSSSDGGEKKSVEKGEKKSVEKVEKKEKAAEA